MFITAVCVLVLIKLQWQKNKICCLLLSLYIHTPHPCMVRMGRNLDGLLVLLKAGHRFQTSISKEREAYKSVAKKYRKRLGTFTTALPRLDDFTNKKLCQELIIHLLA